MDEYIILVLTLIVLSAGCVSQAKEDCNDIGCPVNITQPSKTNNCGNGLLENSEECENAFPCKYGFCQHCGCVNATESELVSDCVSQCRSIGYTNSTVVGDGECTYPVGENNPCAARCSYRKVFPSTEEGMVCCCRDLKYVKCKEGEQGKCECPTEEQVNQICKDNKPSA
ncbi:MAG: hypothetical protein V1744_07870 [Candidatus Altiarchaeota archaeon]